MMTAFSEGADDAQGHDKSALDVDPRRARLGHGPPVSEPDCWEIQ